MNPAIFREYDIRGVADVDFDAAFAHRLGLAFGTLALEQGARLVSVGRDCRLTSDRYAEALRAGIAAAGLDVLDLGVCPTPLVYFSLFAWQLDGGIQITGSHNPADYNGFKICLGREALHGAQIQDLRARIEAGRFRSGQGTIRERPVVRAYQDYLVENIGPLGRPLRVVVDAGNGTAGPVAPEVYRRLGAEVIELFCDMDGRFPNHHPDPTLPENMEQLIAAVRQHGAELGIAFDGDADRIGVVDRHGRIIWGDELLVLYARDVLARNPGAVIVSEVKCSQRLYDDVARRGGRAIMWKAGHSLLKAKMRETDALLGGEMSGHIFFKERYFGYDDAVYAGARLLEILGRTGRTVDALLADLPPSHSTPEIRVDCPDDVKFEVARRVRDAFAADGLDLIDVDGVRVRFPHGWGLLRASNTQPVLVMRFEAESPAALAEYRAAVERAVAAARSAVEGP
ncbi:MAG TPA: phosphomannomutase/phosphoglucomutase [Candidatus Limnocylindria bacterium]|nr:phosphomannomutase/phosphoglucomutase [Candidatus Limnocylindria bacterium]